MKYRLDAKSYFDQHSGNLTFLLKHIDRILGYGSFAWLHYVDLVPTVGGKAIRDDVGQHLLEGEIEAIQIAVRDAVTAAEGLELDRDTGKGGLIVGHAERQQVLRHAALNARSRGECAAARPRSWW